MDPKKGVSWPAIRYMYSEVHYGGRVTDDRDKRLLVTFCNVWFGEPMFSDKFLFYKGYTIPLKKTIHEYNEFIESMVCAYRDWHEC
jgi:dynein heavy chain